MSRTSGKQKVKGAIQHARDSAVRDGEVTQAEVEAEGVQVARQRRERAVGLIAGLWKDREDGPIDGVQYQQKIRSGW